MRRAQPLLAVILFAGCVPSSAAPEPALSPVAAISRPAIVVAQQPHLGDVLHQLGRWFAGQSQAAERRPAAPVARSPGRRSAQSVDDLNGAACGGDLPPCWVLQRESRGNPDAYNPSGCVQTDREGNTYRGCYGLWQFGVVTFRGLGYSGVATDYGADVQNEAARRLWAGGAGCSNWAACG